MPMQKLEKQTAQRMGFLHPVWLWLQKDQAVSSGSV